MFINLQSSKVISFISKDTQTNSVQLKTEIAGFVYQNYKFSWQHRLLRSLYRK